MNDNQEIDNNKLNIKKNKKKILTGKRQSILSPIQSISTTSIPEQQQQQPQLSLSSSSNKLKLNKMAPIKEIQQQKKDKKRERWLLTRKTWKYMTDAGRKLIPDNNNGRTIDDIKKCEKNFHLLCSSEPKFILWRRKASYPGAMGGSNNNNNNNSGNSKKRLKNLLTRSYKSINNNNNNNNIDNEQYNNAEQIMKILQNYLCLDDKSIKTTTLLSTKTIRPDQTISSSSKRPIKYDPLSSSISSLSLLEKQQKNANDTAKQINELLDKLRKYSEKCGNNNNNNNNNIILNINNITPDILDNKILLKKIYNELKKQQLNRILGKYSSKSLNLSSSSHSTSLSNLLNFRNNNNNNNNKNDRLFQIDNDDNNCKRNSDNDNNIYLNRYDKNDLYNNNNNNNQNNNNDIDNNNNKKKKIINKIYIQHGTQTDFINLNELQRLSKEYIDNQQYYCGSSGGGLSPTDDDSDKSNNNNNNYNHRKSSIDNEDVSQSVSDTIKRYLRMARKKSVNDDNNNTIGNRFKRVNYDRNLRNIRSKGEIIPPGMDDGNNIKQTQTLDSWPLILLNYIKGIDNIKLLNDSHKDWENHLKLRLKNKDDYEKKFKLNNYNNNNNNNNEQPQQQIPIIGSGILHSGQQFLSNLWHGHNNSGGSGGGSENSHQPSPANSTISISSAPVGYAQSGLESIFDKSKNKDLQNTMQKSKSSSNVGQFVSKKIWKTRSKSQTRTALLNYNKPDWTPQGNCVWTSANGKRLILTDTKLSDLTEIERTILHRVAIDKINQLNIGVNVTPPTDNSSTNSGIPSKSQKRRPLLIKRKAVTTSFFDSGKNKNDKELSNSLMFGVTLEKCLENDQRMCKDSARSSKNSISSLINDPKGIGSCDSLVTKSIGNLPNSNHSDRVTISGAIGTGVSNLINAATMKLSRSQSDIRRNSQQDYDNLINSNGILGDIQSPPMTGLNRNNGGQKIPAVVISCIKHIEENGLHTVGIFRVSTSKKRVRQLKDDFDRGDVNILDPEICPHDVATLLKEYFRELPEPLLCINLYKAFVKTQKIRNRRLQLEALSHLVQLLPVAHRDTLYILLKFLAKIVRYSDDVTSRDGTILSQGNKMDSNNLATVFAPNILRQIQTTTILSSSSNNNTGIQHNTTEQEIDEQLDVINVIRTMIDHFEELFKIPAELMDEIYTNMLDTFPQQLDYLCQKRDIKNDDEMDSASSNTPLSSPPPILGLNQDGNIQQIFNKFTTTSDNNNQKLIKTNIVTPPTLRRIYSRQVVMHENAAKGDNQNENNNNIIDINDGGGGGGGSGSVSSGARRRDRTSKMKYISSDNENDILRRRRRDRLLSGDGCLNDNKRSLSNTLTNDYHSMAKDDESFTQSNKNNQSSILRCLSNDSSSSSSSLPIQKQQQQQQQQQQLDRRLSTPNVLQHNTGVVTATLKIPLQMQQQQTIIDHGLYNHGKLDLSDIPYIEDCTNGQDFGSLSSTGRHHFAPIIGSISFSGNTQLELNSNNNNNNNNNELLSKTQSFQIPIKYDGKILNSAVTTLSPPSGSFQQLPQTNKMNKSNINNSNNNNNNNNNNDNINNKQKYHIEPKITPSITSIGGDVLRSKTADFERILTQNKKYKSNDILLDNNNSNNNNNNNSDKLIIQPIQHSSSTSIIIEGSNNVPIQKQQQQQQFKNNTHKNGSQGQIYKRQELISSAKRTNK